MGARGIVRGMTETLAERYEREIARIVEQLRTRYGNTEDVARTLRLARAALRTPPLTPPAARR